MSTASRASAPNGCARSHWIGRHVVIDPNANGPGRKRRPTQVGCRLRSEVDALFELRQPGPGRGTVLPLVRAGAGGRAVAGRGATHRHHPLRRPRRFHLARRAHGPRAGEASRRRVLRADDGSGGRVRRPGRQDPRRRHARAVRRTGGPRGRSRARRPRRPADAGDPGHAHRRQRPGAHRRTAHACRHQHRRGARRHPRRHRLHRDGRRREPGLASAGGCSTRRRARRGDHATRSPRTRSATRATATCRREGASRPSRRGSRSRRRRHPAAVSADARTSASWAAPTNWPSPAPASTSRPSTTAAWC